MFGWIKTLTTAGNRLAKSLTALSTTVDEINSGLRAQVGLDRPERSRKAGAAGVLEHTNGKLTPKADAGA
jgi:hypothetical protein